MECLLDRERNFYSPCCYVTVVHTVCKQEAEPRSSNSAPVLIQCCPPALSTSATTSGSCDQQDLPHPSACLHGNCGGMPSGRESRLEVVEPVETQDLTFNAESNEWKVLV